MLLAIISTSTVAAHALIEALQHKVVRAKRQQLADLRGLIFSKLYKCLTVLLILQYTDQNSLYFSARLQLTACSTLQVNMELFFCFQS